MPARQSWLRGWAKGQGRDKTTFIPDGAQLGAPSTVEFKSPSVALACLSPVTI